MINTKSDDWSAARMDPEPVDMEKCVRAASLFKVIIDTDLIEVNHQMAKDGWHRLNNNEKMEVHELLKDKASDSKKSYRNILKEYLSYVPTGILL